MRTAYKPFELDSDSAASLLSVYRRFPSQLRNLDKAVEECEARAQRIVVAQERRNVFIQRIKALQSHIESGVTSKMPNSLTSTPVDEFDEEVTVTQDPVIADWRKSLCDYTGPSVKGQVVSLPLAGRFFRIIKGNEIYYYNDTCLSVMRVTVGFPHDCSVMVAGSTQLTKRLSSTMMEASTVVYPLQTQLLCSCPSFSKSIDRCSEELITYEMESQLIYKGEINEDARIALDEIMAMCPEWMQRRDLHGRRWTFINERVVEECLKCRHLFVDVLFPPSRESLYRHKVDKHYIPPLQWRRHRQYLPPGTHVKLFGKTLCNIDTENTHTINHRLLAILNVLAEDEAKVKNLFRHPESPPKGRLERTLGIFRASVCVAGWWRCVIVDSFVPATCSYPVYCHDAADMSNVWTATVEKVLAKCCGSYAALKDLPTSFFLRALTGSPCFSLDSVWPPNKKDYSKMLRFLRAFRGQTRKIVFETCSVNEACKRGIMPMYTRLGFNCDSAVSCSSAEYIGSSALLALLPNKEAASDWLSLWSEEGKTWTEQVSELVVGLGEESTVWMEAADISRFFSRGYYFYDPSDVDDVRVKGSFGATGAPSFAVKMTVSQPVEVVLMLEQPEDVKRSIVFSVYNSGTGSVEFCGASGNGDAGAESLRTTQSGAGLSLSDHTCCAMKLTPSGGPYYVIPEASGDASFISSYSQQSTKPERTPWVLGMAGEYLASSLSFSCVLLSTDGDAAPFHTGGRCSEFQYELPLVDAEFQVRPFRQRISYHKRSQYTP